MILQPRTWLSSSAGGGPRRHRVRLGAAHNGEADRLVAEGYPALRVPLFSAPLFSLLTQQNQFSQESRNS